MLLALGRCARRKAKFHAVTKSRADHGVGDSSVAAGRVENHFARAQIAATFAFADHGVRGSVFYRPTRIEPFRLGVKLDVREIGRGAIKAQKRRIADAVQQMLTQAFAGSGLIRCHEWFVYRCQFLLPFRATPENDRDRVSIVQSLDARPRVAPQKSS